VQNRAQGDIGEASAIQWLTTQGALVFVPLFRSPNYDLIAELGGRLVRIEVKTSSRLNELGRWEVAICTRGGNQSWSGTTKRFDPNQCDYLFVHVGDGRRWFIPAARVEGATSLALGYRKYAQFEIERGPCLPARTLAKSTTTIATP
jgi:Holliday junction resolvase-like predicted endonuclease